MPLIESQQEETQICELNVEGIDIARTGVTSLVPNRWINVFLKKAERKTSDKVAAQRCSINNSG